MILFFHERLQEQDKATVTPPLKFSVWYESGDLVPPWATKKNFLW